MVDSISVQRASRWFRRKELRDGPVSMGGGVVLAAKESEGRLRGTTGWLGWPREGLWLLRRWL